MAILLIKKRKEEFFKKFTECQSLMIQLEYDILNYKNTNFPTNIKRLFITANKNYRIEMRRIFEFQSEKNLEPNYIMLNGFHDLLINEIQKLQKRISLDKDLERTTLIYNS